ncbi:MAG: glycosyltransferase [Actinomycetota bacterium]|nr:glycosyltransferase [Actinomycetota bacterium]
MAGYRCLIANHAVEMGGAERVLLRFLDCMDREILEPALACPHRGPLVEEMERRGIRVHLGFPTPRLLEVRRRSLGNSRREAILYPYDMALTAFRLARLIKKEGYDLVLTNSAKGDIYGSLAGRLSGRPVVWRLHDIVTGDAFSRLNMTLFRISANLFARRVLAVSEAAREAFISLGVKREKVKVVYNGIRLLEDVSREKAEAGSEEVRLQWGIPLGVPLAGMVGRLVDWKGPDHFLRAASLVSRELPEARFMLVGGAIFGERSFVDDLKRIAVELGLEDRVVFTGFREDVSAIMASLDLLVHASVLPDPLPTVLVEAMSLGLPVVAATGGGVGEIVDDGESGIVVPSGDAESMAGAMTEILSNPDKARDMGYAGLKRAARLFDIGKTTREMERELLEVLSGG